MNSGDGVAQIKTGAKPRDKQCRVPVYERKEYLPGDNVDKTLKNLVIDLSDFTISEECDLKIKNFNNQTFSMICAKDHICSKKQMLKILMREIGQKPKSKTTAFHLRMIMDDPSCIFTVRRFLGKS